MNEEFHDLIEKEIWHYLWDNDLPVWDDDFLDFILNKRESLIAKLKNDNSTQDKNILGSINNIDKNVIQGVINTCIDNNVGTPEKLSEFTYKTFHYTPTSKRKSEGTGGRTKDPKIAKMRSKLYTDYYYLREKGYTKSKAIEILEKQYPWKKSTIVQYLK